MTFRHRRDLVRPFVLTGGRATTRGAQVLDVVTMVTAVPGKPVTGLPPEQLAMVGLCRGGYLSVIEVAGHLGQPVTVTRVLIGDLLDSGLLMTRAGGPGTRASSGTDVAPAEDRVAVLERMLHGLQAL